MSIGDRIKQRREALGLSLEAVGSELGVHRSTVMRYETGDTSRIPLPVIEKLAQVLKTTPACLMGWEADETLANLDPEIKLVARSMQNMPPEKREMLVKIIHTMSDIADEELKKE